MTIGIKIKTKKGKVKVVEVDTHEIYDALAKMCELVEHPDIPNLWSNHLGNFTLTKYGFKRKENYAKKDRK